MVQWGPQQGGKLYDYLGPLSKDNIGFGNDSLSSHLPIFTSSMVVVLKHFYRDGAF